MKFSRFEIVIFTLALAASILTFILPLSPVCAVVALPCEPIYFQQKLPLEGSIIFTSIIFSIAFFTVTFNRIRKEIGAFGGWTSLFLKTIISWLVGAALAVILIWIFWNKPIAIPSLFIGPVVGIILSSSFLYRNKMILFSLFSTTFIVFILLLVIITLSIASTFGPLPTYPYPDPAS